jgi:hypothetical protein
MPRFLTNKRIALVEGSNWWQAGLNQAGLDDRPGFDEPMSSEL